MRRLSLLTVAVLTSCLLGACTTEPGEAGAEVSVPPPSSAPATPSTGPATEVTAGGSTLTVSAPVDEGVVDVVHHEDGTVAVRVGTAPDAPVTITLADRGRLRVNTDSSVTVLDDGGTAVAGLSPVSGRALVTDADPTSVRLDPASDATVAETVLGTEAVESTSWGDREGGRSLAVAPTRWARSAGEAGRDLVWAELVADDPGVDTPVMHDQLVCHAIGAPAKETWNLEPWRPDVGLIAVLADRCNPTEHP